MDTFTITAKVECPHCQAKTETTFETGGEQIIGQDDSQSVTCLVCGKTYLIFTMISLIVTPTED